MSWDVSIFKLSNPYESITLIPKDEQPISLGPRCDVQRAINAVFPGTDWSDPSWGQWGSELGSVEFNLGQDDPTTSFMLHVRAKPEIVSAIVSLCAQNGWRPLDCSSGDFLDRAEDPEESVRAWLAYRDQIISTFK